MHLYLLLYLYLFIVPIESRVDMTVSDVEELKKHPMKSYNVSEIQLQWIVIEEWAKMVASCPELDPGANIHAVFDNTLENTNVLAWASQTILLVDGIWIPSIATFDYMGYDFMIGVNPNPTNGWHISDDCSDIGWRYDLRSVLRHEILHGIGIGSSISKSGSTWSMGHVHNGQCYPRHYDTMIVDANGNNVVDGCTLSDIQGKNIYIDGVKLFNPSIFNPGSSISHHVYPNELMFWMLPPMKCLDIGVHEAKILNRLGLRCSNFSLSAAKQATVPIAPVLSSILLLCYLLLFV
jgi:hypothetical protein